jgi:putative methylase
MQKRFARKLDLEIFLSKAVPYSTPKPNLEQYTISPDAAATMLYIAAYANNDIINKKVLDLGCGTGRLALGAAFLGAKEVVGVDIDRTAVELASSNSAKLDFKDRVQWVATTLEGIRGKFDTTLQNPPFGVQRRHADRKFLEKALVLGRNIYSLHKNITQDTTLIQKLKKCQNGVIQVKPSAFLEKFIEKNGGQIRAVYAMIMTIPHMFDFHTRSKHEFVVDLYVIETPD